MTNIPLAQISNSLKIFFMHKFWINFLAVIITAASFQVLDQRNFDYGSEESIHSLSALEGWDLNPVRESDSKETIKQHYIAQDFIPIVTIASLAHVLSDQIYYLPIYDLTREKNYFLLI